jgi:enoyl-CoA hydratase
MTYTCFAVDIADKIAHIRFNRPEKANSMIPEFWREFPEAIDDISDNARARAIVISAEGKHFTAGMDIAVFMQGGLDNDASNREVDAELFRHTVTRLQRTFSALENARQPVLAAIQGGAIGAGVDLAMAYTAERVPAAKAKEIGLVNEVFETPEALIAGVLEIASRIAAHSPLAVTGSKRMINYARDHATADALDYIAVWNAAMLRPEDLKESYIAKGEKRSARYAELKPVKKSL